MSSSNEERYIEQNRVHWSAVTRIHLRPGGHDLESFKKGGTSLHPIEQEELLPLVKGKSVVHLQCHTGSDSISLSRAGATEVVGVDFDEEAIVAARGLAKSLDLPVTFEHCNVYDAVAKLGRTFDMAFVTHGALCWLPSVDRWAEVVSGLLRPGGQLYLHEFHPLCWSLADESTAEKIMLQYPYFEELEPTCFEGEPDYLNKEETTPAQYCWNHGLGEIVSALTTRGMNLKYLHEFPVCASSIIPVITKQDENYYGIEGRNYPLSYSILAEKQG